jgi:PAS domain S-box-containing protein
MQRRSWLVAAVWVAAFSLLVVNGVLSTYNIDRLKVNDRGVYRSVDISRALADLISTVKDAETGQRGFQITGLEEYLEPFATADGAMRDRQERLVELTGDDHFHIDRVAQLNDLVRVKMDELRRTIEIRRVNKEAARDEIVKGEGKVTMDRIRFLADEMSRHEQEVLAGRLQEEKARYRSATFTAVLGGVVTIVMVGMALVIVWRELAARRLIEADLRRSAAELARSQRQTTDTLTLLDSFLSNAPVGMAFLDRDLRYVRINQALAAANGRAINDHLGRSVAEAVPNMPAAIVADYREVLATGKPLLNRQATGRPGAPERIWQAVYFPVRAEDGRSLGIGIVAQDMTERLAAEARLRESEVRKSAILETALDCVITIDHEGRVVEFNPAAETTFGFRRDEVLGREMGELIVPAMFRDRQTRGMAHYLATGEGPVLNRRLELPATRRDGSEFLAELSITAIETGYRPMFTAYLRDISERKRIVDALRASEARFRTLTEAIPQMVWNADASGRVTYFNRRWAEYTGLIEADAIAEWWKQIAHPEDAIRLDAAWRRSVGERPEPFEQEVRVRDADDGTYRWFLTAVVPLRREDGTVDQWIGSLSSIDDQKRQSEILTALVKMRTAELESANHLLREEIAERTRAEERAHAATVELGRSNEELEKFAYVASHDLQEPLRKIQAFGDRLMKRFRDSLGSDGQEYVDRMKASAARMRTLIDDLLTFSRVTSQGQPFAPVDLTAIVADTVSDLEARMTQTNGRVDVADLPSIAADPFQMRQLFQNLIGNALKFHRPGVPPQVIVRGVAWGRIPSGADPAPPGGTGYRITVADNGIGFNQEYSERIFEVFQRLHGRGEYEGTGIGLAICRKIVQRHGGSIAVRSREGEGTSFIVDLPAAQ